MLYRQRVVTNRADELGERVNLWLILQPVVPLRVRPDLLEVDLELRETGRNGQ